MFLFTCYSSPQRLTADVSLIADCCLRPADWWLFVFTSYCFPQILVPKPQTLNHKLTTSNPQSSTLNPQPSTLNPQSSTLKLQTLNRFHRRVLQRGMRTSPQDRHRRASLVRPPPSLSVKHLDWRVCSNFSRQRYPNTYLFMLMSPLPSPPHGTSTSVRLHLGWRSTKRHANLSRPPSPRPPRTSPGPP